MDTHPSEPSGGTHTVTGTSSDQAAHASSPGLRTTRTVAAVCGLIASCAAAVVGISALVHSPETTKSNPTSAGLITVGPRVPLSDKEVVALLGRVPNFGALSDPKRRSACLRALGHGTEQVLGAEPVQIGTQQSVVLVLAGARHDELIVFAVAASCSSADTGLIADRTVHRP